MRASILALLGVAGLISRTTAARADDRADEREELGKAESFTIEDLLKVAVRVAPELQTAAFDVSSARAGRTSAGGIEDWTVTADNTTSLTKDPASTTDSYAADGKLSRLLSTNGLLTVAATANEFIHTEPRANNKNASFNVSVSVSQPLLANAGESVEKALIREADHALSAATIRRTAVAREFVSQVTESYWQLALSWRRLDVLRASLAAAEKALATIQRGLQTGAIAKSEEVPFQQSIASRRISIANAEADIISQSVALRLLVGLELPPDAPVIHPVDLPRATAVPIDTAELVRRAIATSDQLHAALEDARGAEAGLAAADRNLLPSLSVSLTGQISGTHDSVPLAIEALKDAPGFNVVLGATFALPLGNHTAKGAYAITRASVARTRFAVLAERKTITADVISLANTAKTSARTIALSEQVVALAQQNVDAEQRKFELGKSTSNDVVLRQQDLETARLQVETANADSTIALTKIEAATGAILQHYSLHMTDPDQLVDTELGRKP